MGRKVTQITGTLEIDHERGVVYFHSSIYGMKKGALPTPLRICGLGTIEHPLGDRQIDVTIRDKEVWVQK